MSQEPKYASSLPLWMYVLPIWPLIIYGIDVYYDQDQYWFLSINHLTSQLPDLLWTNLSLFGNGWSVFAIAFSLLIFQRKPFYAAVISGVFAGIFSHAAKAIFDTNRPAGVLDHSVFHIIEQPLTHSAMPSGHTMTAFSIATAIYFSIPPLKRGPWSFVFFIAMATGLSRIAVGAHWPEDVLVGSSLGMTAGIIGAILVCKIPDRFLELSVWPAKIVFLSSLICFYLLITTKIDFAINYNTQIALAILIALTWVKIFPKIFLDKH